jgi:hypothetical protein
MFKFVAPALSCQYEPGCGADSMLNAAGTIEANFHPPTPIDPK